MPLIHPYQVLICNKYFDKVYSHARTRTHTHTHNTHTHTCSLVKVQTSAVETAPLMLALMFLW